MAINFLLKRSNTASKRPTAAQLDIGELSLNYEQNTCGVYFEDSNGDVRKVGPVEVSSSAPNSTPAGSSGNSLGELWYDTGSSNLKIWTGASFVSATSSVAAGGSNTQVQFNSTGSLAGSSNFVFDGTNVGIGTSNPQEILHIKAASETINSRDGVTLENNAALAADTGLPIVWSGDIGTITNYGIASIAGRKENATSGNAAGYLQFGTSTSAGAIVERMRINSDGHVVPGADSTYDLGLTGTRWRAVYADDVYAGDLHMKNDRGDYTLIEEEDALTIRNNKTGKVYNIMMTEREV